MTAPARTDPVPTDRVGAGSRRSPVVPALVVGLVVASLVRGLLLETYHVPSAVQVPTVEPGDRVLVLRTDRDARAGDLALVEATDGAARLVPSRDVRGEAAGSVVLRYWPPSRVGRVVAPTTSALP
ncbi:hypothetical protein JQN72_10910 [Phycicoccus sp. CSK15P-2]|uniref:hypothetical protein n=1 Tax=Phycicoccus sp. CSK15P-2 TaxID=2807627 RepID=UPI00194DEE42|nr:hypothetical protein [Phycicoccus sp. CSK15P-2]MBM6404752.1 hypothetical protein [Phycicoccus sp. CSK15P-2]